VDFEVLLLMTAYDPRNRKKRRETRARPASRARHRIVCDLFAPAVTYLKGTRIQPGIKVNQAKLSHGTGAVGF